MLFMDAAEKKAFSCWAVGSKDFTLTVWVSVCHALLKALKLGEPRTAALRYFPTRADIADAARRFCAR